MEEGGREEGRGREERGGREEGGEGGKRMRVERWMKGKRREWCREVMVGWREKTNREGDRGRGMEGKKGEEDERLEEGGG